MEICGKCGREPWDGTCNLLPEPRVTSVVKPRKNQYTKVNCGHPAIGESPLIIEAAERNKLIRERQALARMHIEDMNAIFELEHRYILKTTNHNQSSA